MGIYLGANALGGGSGGAGGGGGASLTGTTTYRALLIGGGGNGHHEGTTYWPGGSGAGAFFETILPFFSDIAYNVTVAGGGGTTIFETAIGKFYAPPGGRGDGRGNGVSGASGGGAGGNSSNFYLGGRANFYNHRGEFLADPYSNRQYISNSSYEYIESTTAHPGAQTMGYMGGWADSSTSAGGGGGAGGPGQNDGYSWQSPTGGVGRKSDIITTTTATAASVGSVSGSDVWFGRGGYGGILSTINTSYPGHGPGTGGGGQGSTQSPGGVSSGDSGCVILKVPTTTDFTQTGASTYTDQGMTAIIWAGAGTFQINS